MICMKQFLPMSRKDIQERGWDTLDFVLITGDAYIDHPSFGIAIVGRVLEHEGYKVGIIAQPNWKDISAFKKLGRPRLGFMITGGNIDSMVNHYSVAKKRRSKDAYSPGGKMGLRPDRAVAVYAQKVREAYEDIPIILGGIEASLRRMSHYDYWEDQIRPSILLEAKADLVVYGMGEHQIVEIAEALEHGIPIEELTYLKGTIYKTKDFERVYEPIVLPSYEAIRQSKEEYAKSFMIQYENTDAITAKPLIEAYGDIYVVQNPPAQPLTQSQLDAVYALSYMRTFHPIYEASGGVPAIEEIRFSVISNRGCFGSCNFCALGFHQGRVVQARSHPSIVAEAEKMVWEPDFKGYIHDVGGPTANFRHRACDKQVEHGVCKERQCLFPTPCKQLHIDHEDYMNLLRKLRELPNVKKIFVRSGIRYDYLIQDKNEKFFEELCKHHISGQLKVAPEHISSRVLQKMGKPNRDVYDRFVKKYYAVNEKLGMKQFLVPYLMSSHPGSDLKAAIELAEYLRDMGYMPEQVQDFYPTPGTLSTCMYYTELDPRTMEKVYVPKSAHEKAMQRALIQYRLPQNYALVYEALTLARRQDLIGFEKKCLIRPKKGAEVKKTQEKPRKKKTIRNVHEKKGTRKNS